MSTLTLAPLSGPRPEPTISDASTPVLQREFGCGTCGGQMAFDPDRQALRCGHCGAESAIATTAEFALDEICLTRAAVAPVFDLGAHGTALSCQACAGEVVFLGRELSARCPYCDGPVVRREGASGFAPAGVAPFRVVETTARERIGAWFRSRWLMPSALQNRASGARLAGVYAPFWTFDASVVVRYVGQRGRKVGKNVQWTTVSGTLTVPFDDILMPASHHVTPDIRDATGPWPVTALIDFEPRVLAGFAAELHRVPAQDAASQAREDIQPMLEGRVRKDIGGSRQRITSMDVEMQGTTCRSMLLPLWILHYDHGDRHYRVIASGVSGRAFGERPFCPTKVQIASLIATLAAALLGAAIGLAHAGLT